MTLNQIIAKIEGFAAAHAQLNTFFYGDPLKLMNKKNVVYPAMVLYLADGITVKRSTKLTLYPFQVYILDLVNTAQNSEENYADIESDLMLITQDVCAMITNEAKRNSDFNFEGDITCKILEEQFDSLALCVNFPLPIATMYNANKCQVPINGIDTSTPSILPIDNSVVNVPTGNASYYLPAGTLIKAIWFKGGSAAIIGVGYSEGINDIFDAGELKENEDLIFGGLVKCREVTQIFFNGVANDTQIVIYK